MLFQIQNGRKNLSAKIGIWEKHCTLELVKDIFKAPHYNYVLMTAQIANGGFEIKPRILFDGKNDNLRDYLKFKNENPNQPLAN